MKDHKNTLASIVILLLISIACNQNKTDKSNNYSIINRTVLLINLGSDHYAYRLCLESTEYLNDKLSNSLYQNYALASLMQDEYCENIDKLIFRLQNDEDFDFEYEIRSLKESKHRLVTHIQNNSFFDSKERREFRDNELLMPPLTNLYFFPKLDDNDEDNIDILMCEKLNVSCLIYYYARFFIPQYPLKETNI